MTKGRYLTYAFLLITAILFCWWYWVTPYYNDDIVFMAPWCVQQDGETWLEYNAKSPLTLKLFIDKAYALFHMDAFRGFNLLASFFVWLPKWIFNILTTILFFIAAILGAKIANISLKQYNRFAGIVLSMLLFMPWTDGLTCIAYSVNYIWPIPLLGLYILFYQHPERYPLWLSILVAVILGGGHEMMGLPLFGSTLLTNWQKTQPSLRKRRWIIAISVLIPTIILIGIAFHGRLQFKSAYQFLCFGSLYDIKNWIFTIFCDCTFIPLLLFFCIFFWKKFRASQNNIFMITLTILFFCEAIALTMSGLHVYFFPAYLAIITFFQIFQLQFPQPILHFKKYAITLWAILLFIVSGNLYAGASCIKKLSKEQELIIQKHYKEHNDRQTYPITPWTKISLLGYHRYSYLFYYYRCSPWSAEIWDLCLQSPTGTPLPVPDTLYSFSDDAMATVPGRNSLYWVNEWMVSPDSITSATISFKFAPQLPNVEVIATPFLRNDGRRFYYITFLNAHNLLKWKLGVEQINTTIE